MSTRLLAAIGAAVALVFLVSSGRVCCAQASQLPSRVVITGSVVDGSLSPLGGVRIALQQTAGVVMRTTSGTDGTFRFAEVAPGAYQVRAEHAGFPLLTRDLRVPRGVASLQLPLVMVKPGEQVAAPPSPGGTYYAPPPPSSPVSASQSTAARASEGGRNLNRMADAIGAAAPMASAVQPVDQSYRQPYAPPAARGEGYAHVQANRFRRTTDEPLSTFGADVDTASFTNVRRFIRNGQLPPVDAVRVEEFVNYFRFDYAAPQDGHPIGVTTEVGDCPWEPRHKLVLIGARAVAPRQREVAGRNIVLLIDVSGSMAPADRLPLIKSGLGLFVDSLAPTDRIAIVTYAGSSGVVLPSTPVRDRERVLSAISELGAGGSTNGAQGLLTAYRIARQAFIPGGINRVILATDGDFNVGVTSHDGLLKLITREKESGVFLSVLGVGSGNLQDATMEMLANKGNGHYAYLDSLQEARRVLVREADSTVETVAKDVKFQVEFNPAQVASWKLVGYENRLLAHEDFNDDRKDGGEMGAGHTVTVLYEIVPVGAGIGGDDEAGRPVVDPLRYQSRPESRPVQPVARGAASDEWLTVKVRYQEPEGQTSRLISRPVRAVAGTRLAHLPFAAAVAEYGALLRDSRPLPARWDSLVRRLEAMPIPAARAGDRDAVVELVTLARGLKRLE